MIKIQHPRKAKVTRQTTEGRCNPFEEARE
jgi:hypothetical protein